MASIRNIDSKLHRAAKMQAVLEGISLKVLTERALEQYLEAQHRSTEPPGLSGSTETSLETSLSSIKVPAETPTEVSL